jgi:hypothetical protein
MKPEYLIILILILAAFYFIFFKKETFINKKLENFNGDDLNIHNEEYTLNTDNHDNNHNNNDIIIE